MDKIKIECKELIKRYNSKIIFKNVSFDLENGMSLSITGRNGTGKSTLVKILSGLIKQDSGEYNIILNGKDYLKEKKYKKIGFLATYYNLYDEFTGYENLKIYSSLLGIRQSEERIKTLLELMDIYKSRNELVRNYSSGMKQRLKISFSILNSPQILILDEPRTNLDTSGIKILQDIIEEQKRDKILIIATNDDDDVRLCTDTLNIENYK